MGLIQNLTPLNLTEEKNKFFNNFNYNPQFRYKKTFIRSELNRYGLPQKKFYEHAQKMINKYGVPKFYKDKPLNKKIVTDKINSFFTELGIKAIPIKFSKKFVSGAALSKNELKIKTPIYLSLEQLQGKINHEIQTHLLRKINSQITKLKSKETIELRKTEEGLANLNSYINRKDKIIKKTYTNYIAVWLSQHHSFSETFHRLTDLGIDNELAFSITLKQKRGLTDTSQPGGFSKNLVYFEGSVQIWDWIINRNGDPKYLYLGRISLEQVNQYKQTHQQYLDKIFYPTFFKDLEKYKGIIQEIGNVNQFDKLIS